MRSHMTRPGGPEILSTEADKVPAPAAIRPREKDTLTDRQKQVLSFISESISERGYPPTLREIGERMGIRRDGFALRVRGDSMIEAGIFDGDYIFVRKQATAHAGEIVVAMINDEATVKYFYPEADQIVFKPANRTMQPIVVRRRDFKP